MSRAGPPRPEPSLIATSQTPQRHLASPDRFPSPDSAPATPRHSTAIRCKTPDARLCSLRRECRCPMLHAIAPIDAIGLVSRWPGVRLLPNRRYLCGTTSLETSNRHRGVPDRNRHPCNGACRNSRPLRRLVGAGQPRRRRQLRIRRLPPGGVEERAQPLLLVESARSVRRGRPCGCPDAPHPTTRGGPPRTLAQ